MPSALFGSVLFLSAVPILPPAVGFPALPCLLLIKQTPKGRDWGGVRMCMLAMSHPSIFLPHQLPPSLKQVALEGQFCTAAVSLHCRIFTTHSSLCHTLPLSFILFAVRLLCTHRMLFLCYALQKHLHLPDHWSNKENVLSGAITLMCEKQIPADEISGLNCAGKTGSKWANIATV